MNHLHTAQWSGVLVYCLRSALTKSSDGAQNVIGRLDPLEGLWMRVGHHDVLTDGGLERMDTRVCPATELAFGE